LFLIPKQTRNHRTDELVLMQRWVVMVQDAQVRLLELVMTDFRALLADLRRPQLLIRAARCGLADYRRDRDLRRILDAHPSSDRAVRRIAGLTRHIEVLIALMCEVRLLPRAISA
jgi:hypothetical protein